MAECLEDDSMKKEICPLFSKCGACDYSCSYEDELDDKTEYVHSLFKFHCPTYETIGSEIYGYRNKVAASFGYDRSGRIISGLYIKGTHRLVEKRNCPLEFDGSGEILRSIRKLMKSYGITPYDEDRFSGDLRHVLLRRGNKTGEVLVLLILGHSKVKRLKEFARSIKQENECVVTVSFQVNDEKTSMILSSNPVKTLVGPGFIHSKLFDLDFRISPSSFFQINDSQTERLYAMAIKMAGLSKIERVLDAYSGTGTISMIASRYSKEVIGVEENSDAVDQARRSAEENGIANVRFEASDASAFLKNEARNKEKYDVAFLDPPRKGSDEKFLSSLIKVGPRKVVYISCNPETCERDIRYLEKFGNYKTVAVQPVDMFPRTRHVEAVVLLEKY